MLMLAPISGYAAMLKGLIVCFAVLFAQLAVLHVIDARLYNSPQDARQTAVTSVTPHKDEKEDEEDVQS
ncbi:hypothetical protein HZU72_13350 [Halomonas sp. QX-2]|jgi:hypothetical protein|uniref:Uncharacterized protein n=1 Tax=Vreelandella sedimenti TaxID=2729618 RepID=A0A7Z0N843_9GAMM|nr:MULTISPECIES: hypothetical protein [Halomonas]NYT73409.1 hypothetical protein [Halomonas sedimenti]|tara:strand:+ start:26113 stop:26319 length:207 start_codon:yes stop_codon:yes gene_type:complete